MSAVVLSVEHGGRAVPPHLRRAFAGAAQVLDSHRGWDAGALELAAELARDLRAPLFALTVSRLVVDANRSRDSAGLFSQWTAPLPAEERERLVARHWAPHRTAVCTAVREGVRQSAGRPVVHLSIHSFTPVLDGVARDMDVGILYDPERARERDFAAALEAALAVHAPELAVAHNRPYLGTDDGLTTHLRAVFSPEDYLGLEVEVSQARVFGADWPGARARLRAGLADAVGGGVDVREG